ncbi:MAG: hypothetical protein ACLTW9_24735 [Enterocloster sp.]
MLKANLYKTNTADGQYDIKSKGSLMARLSWADAEGELEEYSPFCLPATGYRGERPVPIYWRPIHSGGGVRGLCKKTVTADFSEVKGKNIGKHQKLHMTYSAPSHPDGMGIRIGLMSDLHMTNKPGRINNGALRRRERHGHGF